MGDDDHDFVSILLSGDGVLGTEPLLDGFERPSHLVCPRPGFNQKNFTTVDYQVSVESAEPGDVGVNVVNETDFEYAVCK